MHLFGRRCIVTTRHEACQVVAAIMTKSAIPEHLRATATLPPSITDPSPRRSPIERIPTISPSSYRSTKLAAGRVQKWTARLEAILDTDTETQLLSKPPRKSRDREYSVSVKRTRLSSSPLPRYRDREYSISAERPRLLAIPNHL